MSQLNINRNIFLEKEELVRFQSFLQNDVSSSVFLGNTTQFGVIKTDFVTDKDFKIEVGTNVGTIKIGVDSKAVDINYNLILQEAIDNISIPQDSSYYWIKISHVFRRYEVGTVSVDINGNLVGVDTVFTDVLRQQSTKVPTKIKFYKEGGGLVNTGVYEVLGITNDLSCVLQGDFTAESSLKYIVLGSLAIGESVTSQIEEGLYKYDSCNIELIAEEIEDTAPTTGYTEDEDFYLARVINNGGTVTIEDKRQFWSFNIEGIDNKLDKSANLGDLSNPATARTNLDVYSKSETETLLGVDDTGWKDMVKGDKINSSGFHAKIRRIGKHVSITAIFSITTGQNLQPDDTLFSIAYSTIGIAAAPGTTIYFQVNVIESNQENHGFIGYVEYYDGLQDTLFVKVSSNNEYFGTDQAGKSIAVNINYLSEG